jgi:VIT1/CCC1 family predicted Fe2+/Mn2+ transporter
MLMFYSTFYKHELHKVQRLVAEQPEEAREEIRSTLEPFALSQNVIEDTISNLEQSPSHMVDYIMRFCRCELEPDSRQATVTSITIGLGYLLGGLVPLLPYFFVSNVYSGLQISVIVMIIALFIFGYVKACSVVGFSSRSNVKLGCSEGMKMVFVGSCAAVIAMGAVKLGDGVLHKKLHSS